MTFLEKIQNLLAVRGLKQGELERLAGLSANRISKWKDDQGEPTARQALRIARLLQVPVAYLIDDDLDEIPSEETAPPKHDEDLVIEVFRALKEGPDSIDHREAIRRLTRIGPVSIRYIGPGEPGQ